MRRARGWIGAAAGLVVLAGGLAIIDDRVRYSIKQLLEGNAPTGDIADAGTSLQDTAMIIVQAIRDQSIEHAPLTLFVVGAMVLVLFMTKT